MNELFFHECRAAGLVFKTSNDWCKWLTENSYDIKKPVAEHEGSFYVQESAAGSASGMAAREQKE